MLNALDAAPEDVLQHSSSRRIDVEVTSPELGSGWEEIDNMVGMTVWARIGVPPNMCADHVWLKNLNSH